MKCWASHVSPCSNSQSREHYITQGLFRDKLVQVEGASFLGGGKKVISKASWVRKCLCTKHNGMLSVFDAEAISFAKALEYANQLSIQRSKSGQARLSIHRKYIHTENFIRWMLKTYIGMLDFFPMPSAVDIKELAAWIFNEQRLLDNVELTFSLREGDEFNVAQVVSVRPMVNGVQTVGLRIRVYGVEVQALLKRNELKKKNLKLKFKEPGKGISCLIVFN